MPVINRIIPKFKNVVFTQDWHPEGHISFASSHPGEALYSMIDVSYGKQVLWPEHCVQDTAGAEFAEGLNTDNGVCFVKKARTRTSTATRLSLKQTARPRQT